MSFFGTRRQTEPAPLAQPEKPEVPKPSAPQSPVGFETVLGANSTLEGTLRSSSNIRLDGTFKGTLEITGNILVGETAKIEADVNTKNISIAGAVRGNITGKKVQILRTGRVWGDIQAAALTTEEGAFLQGKITMVSHESTPPAEPPLESTPPAGMAPVEPETAISDQPEDLLHAPADDILDDMEAPPEPQ